MECTRPWLTNSFICRSAVSEARVTSWQSHIATQTSGSISSATEWWTCGIACQKMLCQPPVWPVFREHWDPSLWSIGIIQPTHDVKLYFILFCVRLLTGSAAYMWRRFCRATKLWFCTNMYESDSMDEYSGDDEDALCYYNIFGIGYPDLTRPTLSSRDRRRRRKLDDDFLLNLMGAYFFLLLLCHKIIAHNSSP